MITPADKMIRRVLIVSGWKMLAVAGLLIAGLSLTACHTVEGAGRDVQAVGGGVEGTADRARPYE